MLPAAQLKVKHCIEMHPWFHIHHDKLPPELRRPDCKSTSVSIMFEGYRRSSCPAVLCVRMSWRVQSLPAVDTGSADSASPHTGTSLLHQVPVPSVEKDPEQDLDCRQMVRPALYKVRSVC